MNGVVESRLRRWLWRALAAAVVLAMGHLVYREDHAHRQRGPYVLDVEIATRDSGYAQVFFDRGDGFRQEDSSSALLTASSQRTRVRFPLGLGQIRRLRLDYLNGSDSPAALSGLRIVDASSNALVRALPLVDLRPNPQIAAYQIVGDVLEVTARLGADDPNLIVSLDPPLQLGPTRVGRWLAQSPGYLALLVVFAVAAWVLDAWVDRRWRHGRTAPPEKPGEARPRWIIAAVAAVSVVLSCHPVIFAGRSFVSPGYGLALLHPDHATASGAAATTLEDVNASDIGATLWQHLPYSVVQHRALLEDGALPLWNRYNSCGSDLFGQGQSMLGDPFHLPVILAGGASWAWDAKYVVARFLFAAGAGLAAFALTRRLGPAALIALSAPFLGFFSYRLNHPAYVTLCYSPWLLAAWLEIGRASERRRAAPWFAVLVAANWCVLTSGTVKEAAMAALFLNLVGLLGVVIGPQERRLKLRILAATAALMLGGLLATAPWWMAFTQAIQSAWTAYDSPYALRIPPARLAGVFDGMLYSEFYAEHTVYAPSANFVVLLGVLLLLGRAKRIRRDGPAIATVAGLVATLSLAFDVPWLPTSWILAVPGFRSVGHVGNTFSCVALPLLLVVAARGFALAEQAAGERRRIGPSVIVAGLAGLLVSALLGSLAVEQLAATAPRSAWDLAGGHAYFLQALGAMFAGWLLLGVAFRWIHQRTRAGAGALMLAAALLPALARHGQTLHAGHDEYFVNPAPRADLATPSPAVEWLKLRSGGPSRVVGVSGHLMPGYAAVHGLESPNGPDALVNRHYRELTEAAGLAPRGDWYFPSEPADLAPRQRLLDMLNVRHYVTCRASPNPPAWTHEIADLDLTVHESPSAWPRAFFTDSVFTYVTPEDLIHRIANGDGRPFAAVQDDAAPPDTVVGGSHANRTIVPASDYHLGTQETEFTVAVPGRGMIVLTETWSPDGFAASVDGLPAALVRVNHAFKGVPVTEAGLRRIRITRTHPRATPSLLLGLGGIAVILSTLLFLPRERERRPSTPDRARPRHPEVAHD